jgi:hypothetical protein
VLNPKALPRFLDNEPQHIPDDYVKPPSFLLSRFIRVLDPSPSIGARGFAEGVTDVFVHAWRRPNRHPDVNGAASILATQQDAQT